MPITEEVQQALKLSVGGFQLGKILEAVLAALICLLVIRLLLRFLDRMLAKSRINPQVGTYLRRGVKGLLCVLAVILVCGCLGVNMTSLTALLSVLTLGVTLATESLIGNVAGGAVILSTHPFQVGDYIETSGGAAGTVREMGLSYTKLETFDGQIVLQPNKELSASRITNFSTLGRRRVVCKVTASYDAPTETVKAACRRALEQTENLLEDPAPTVYLTAYKESSIEYTVYCWATPENWWGAYLALGEHLRDAFREYGVEMTYNHLNVHIIENQS